MRSSKARVFALGAALATIGSGACQSAPTEPEVESYIQTQDGVLVHYQKVGSGEPVLVVPAASWASRDMEDLARGRTVLFYDPRGRGRSETTRAPLTFERDLADLEELRAWFGLERFAILGMDYWAAVASHYAAQHPDRVEALVLVSPLPVRQNPYLKIYDQIYKDRLDPEANAKLRDMRKARLDRTDPEAWATAYRKALFAPLVASARSLERMKSSPFVEPNLDPERATRRYRELMRSLGDFDWRADLAQVACPTLVVYGDTDPMPADSSKEWANAVPDGRAQMIEGSGRLPWVEQPSAFFSTVEGFLAGTP